MIKLTLKDNFLSEISKKNCYTIKNRFNHEIISNFKKPFFINLKKKSKIKKPFLDKYKKIFSSIFISEIFFFKKKIYSVNKLNYNCRQSTLNDKTKILEICREETSSSRFTKDNQFKKSLKKDLRATWINNFFLGKRGSKLFIFLSKKKILGFTLIIEKKNNIIIDLIVVSRKQQNKGVGSSLINYINNFYYNKGKKFIITGTQNYNKKAINFYKKMKFEFLKKNYCYHFHS